MTTSFNQGEWFNELGQIISGSSNLFMPIDSPIHQRNIIIIGNEFTVYQKFSAHKKRVENEFFAYTKVASNFYDRLRKKDLGNKIMDDSNFPNAFKIDEAKKQFNFWPGHPIDGGVYACTSLEPNLYIPIASFHDFIFKSKMSAFMDMCSNLNAKSAHISYVEEEGEEITSKLEIENIPTNIGLVNVDTNMTFKSKILNGYKIEYAFPQQKNILEFHSPWLTEEPSWKTLNNIRFNRDVREFQVEVNHNSNYGIDSNLVAKLNNIGAALGGTYSSFKKRRLVYDVKFWPK